MRWIGSLVLVGLLAVACSGDDEPAAPNPATSEAASSATPSDTTTTPTLRPPPPTDPPERPAPTIGDLVIPCRPAEGVALPEQPGVASDAITIGTGSDRGGLGTPRAGNGIIEMVEVLVDLCNSHGGIDGRDVRVVEYDAAAVEAVDRVEEACGETVALVGHRFLQEVETAFAAAACGLPLFTAGTALVPPSPFGLHGHLTALFADPEIAGSVVLVGPDTPWSALGRSVRRRALETLGGLLTVVGEVVYPIDSVPNWERIAGEVRALGAGQVHLSGGCEQAIIPFIDSAERAGWRPVVVATASAYDPDCLASAQPDRLLIEVPFLPFEDGSDAAATRAHAELLDQIAAPRTGMGLLAATEFWRWAAAATECLADEDPQCWTEARASQEDWTAGGLHPALASDGTSEGCAVVLGIENGEFVRRLPADPGTYDCAPERSVVLPVDG
jgi:ABC-type branched-subunit amino acid transport system substrate-binding protein